MPSVCVRGSVCVGGKKNTVSGSLFLRRFAHPCGFVVVELYLGLQNVITLPAGIREKEWIRKRKNVKVKLLLRWQRKGTIAQVMWGF